MHRYLNNPIRFLIALAFTISLCATFADAQKGEHYNSPLYSPKYYDPSQGTANGIPEPLKKVGIEQRLGEQLPLAAEFKDENGQIVKLGDYFGKGRPAILAEPKCSNDSGRFIARVCVSQSPKPRPA